MISAGFQYTITHFHGCTLLTHHLSITKHIMDNISGISGAFIFMPVFTKLLDKILDHQETKAKKFTRRQQKIQDSRGEYWYTLQTCTKTYSN